MSRLPPLLDNTKYQKFSFSEYKKDCDNIRTIANKTIGELQSDLKILVFPPRVEETHDKIKDSVIFNLTQSENEFNLETGNIMGFIGCNDTLINICSRFTHGNKNNNDLAEKDYFLHYMLEKVCHVNLSRLESTHTPEKIFELLPYLFPQYLISALTQGLYKEYQTHEYNNSNVRGVIDVNRHIKFNIPANGKIAYRTREYSFDNPLTQLVRHTIEYMRSSSSFKHILNSNEDIKDAVSKIVNATPSYNKMERNKILSKTTRTIKSPYFYKYQDLQKICRMILLREKIKYDSSNNKIYGILFDGAWLWEEYLALTLKQKGFVHPENKNRNGVVHPFSSCNVGKFYPDFYLPRVNSNKKEELADTILDAKYKNFDTNNPPADDLAQMIAYVHVMDADCGKFVYPSKNINEVKPDWKLKKFGGKEAIISTLPFYIPQDADSDEAFRTRIKQSEDKLKEEPFNL